MERWENEGGAVTPPLAAPESPAPELGNDPTRVLPHLDCQPTPDDDDGMPPQPIHPNQVKASGKTISATD